MRPFRGTRGSPGSRRKVSAWSSFSSSVRDACGSLTRAAPGLLQDRRPRRTKALERRPRAQPIPDRGYAVSSLDLELNCDIRNALTRHSIDLTKTNFFARRGHVHLSGRAAVVGANRPPEATAAALKAFESELRRLREVHSVSFEFTNWARDETGAWICLERKKLALDPEATAGPERQDGAAPGA